MGDVSISWWALLILHTFALPQSWSAVNGTIFLVCLRFEIDPARLRVNERQLYTNVLNPGKGRLVFVVTLKPCWGVSISDINAAPLEQPDERDTILEKFVNAVLFCSIFILFFNCKGNGSTGSTSYCHLQFSKNDNVS